MKKSSVPYTSHFFHVKKRIATEAQIQSRWSEIFSQIASPDKEDGPKAAKSIKKNDPL